MTRSVWRAIVTAYPCPVCDAAPGHLCFTTGGRPKNEPHADRARLASANDWRDPDGIEQAECLHCHDDPPRGHECPRCGRVSAP